MPPFAEAALLGVVQGLTEFLPISSDGHLALAALLFRDGATRLSTMGLFQLGTLCATLLVFRRQIAALSSSALASARAPSALFRTGPGKDLLFLLVASVPAVGIGLFARDAVHVLSGSPLALSMGFLLTGALLFSSLWAPLGTVDHPPVLAAFLVGTAQGMAILPGVSRSGSTIVLALWLGIRPSRAFDLSMLASVPAILVLLVEASGSGHLSVDAGPAALGVLLALLVGVVVLPWIRAALLRGLFPLFAFWVVPLGLATLALAWAWPAHP